MYVQTQSPFVHFDGTTEPQPIGRASATQNRIVVRLNPEVEVGGDRVGVVQFGGSCKWVRSSFDQFVLPRDSTSAALLRVEDVQSLVRYSVKSDVEVVVDREFWTFAEALQ